MMRINDNKKTKGEQMNIKTRVYGKLVTGKSMFEILCLVNDMMPEDVKVVTLLKRKKDSPPVDHFCFEIGDEWVVGYGLDDNSLKRNYRNIYKLN